MNISYKEFSKKAMPEEKRKTARVDIIGHYLFRPLSNVLSIPLIKKGISATSVTKFSLVFPLAAMSFFMFLQSNIGFWLGWIAIFIWNILDGVDGDIARYTDTCSDIGGLWDATVGWIATLVFFIGMGFTAYYHSQQDRILSDIPPVVYLVLGFFAAIENLFPRLVMHKKENMMGQRSVGAVKDRGSYSLAKIIVFNLNSVNGLGWILFAVGYCLKLNGLCVICFFLLNTAMCLVSLYNLMRTDGSV